MIVLLILGCIIYFILFVIKLGASIGLLNSNQMSQGRHLAWAFACSAFWPVWMLYWLVRHW